MGAPSGADVTAPGEVARRVEDDADAEEYGIVTNRDDGTSSPSGQQTGPILPLPRP